MENLKSPVLQTLQRLIVCVFGFSLLSSFAFPQPAPASRLAPVIFEFECFDGNPGDIVCIPLHVHDFTDIVIAQFEIFWNSDVLEYINVQSPGLPQINLAADFNQTGPNALKFIPLGFPLDGVSLPDDAVLFEVCFRIIGSPGQQSVLTISPFYTFEVADIVDVVPADSIPCTMTVLDATNLIGFVSSCGPQIPGGIGSIDISVFGGTAPYNVTWLETGSGTSGGPVLIANEGESAILSVPAGIYDLTVTDASGSIISLNSVVDPVGLEVNTIISQPTCYKFQNGTIRIQPEGGSSPYSYIWKSMSNSNRAGSGYIPTAGNTALITSLDDGIYEITVSDANGCEIILQDTLLYNPFVFTFTSHIDASCEGSMDGLVDIEISGGTPDADGAYLIRVSPFFQTQSPSIQLGQLNPGEYCITVSDVVPQCDTVFCFVIGYADTIRANVTPVNPLCVGENGQVIIRGTTNGVSSPSYSYSIFENGILVTNATNVVGNFTYGPLDAGTYQVLVFEGSCHSDTIEFTLTDPAPIDVAIDGLVPDNCIPGNNSGDIWFTVNGAATPYTLEVGQGFQDGDTIFNIGSGNHTLTLTDGNGCEVLLPFYMPDGAENADNDISFVFDGTPCEGGTVTVLYQGNPITIPSGIGVSWSNGDVTPTTVITETDILGVTVLLPAPMFCILSDTVHVECVKELRLSITVEQPLCGEGAIGGPTTGSVLVDTMNATQPVTWIWSVPDTTSSGFYGGLEPGWYYVTVTDGLDSTVVDSFEIIAPPSIGLSFSDVVPVSCPLTCDGGVNVQPTGGDPAQDYTIFWGPGGVNTETGATFTIQDLCAGNQIVQITQDQICFYKDSVDIPIPNALNIDTVSVQNVSCFGLIDGSIEIAVSGGTAPYSYNWSNNPVPPATTMNAGLDQGVYAVTVSDDNGCTNMATFTIEAPDLLSVSIDSAASVSVSCGGDNDGTITLSVSGGTPGYAYSWDPNVSSSVQAFSVGIGNYSITVTDANNCTATTSYEMTAPPPIVVAWPTIVPPLCFGDETFIVIDQVTGGSGDYMYNINGGQLFELGDTIPVPAGIYVITIFDDRGCTEDSTYTVFEPNPIELSILPFEPVIDLGDSLELVGIIDLSDNPIAGYEWSPPSLVTCVTCEETYVHNTVPTEFFFTVTDVNGCTGVTSIVVDVDLDRDVYIPNVFTPNYDGRNDNFRVFTGLGVVSIDRMEIFDRWGNMVHAEYDLDPSPEGAGNWDGTYKGQEVNPGVFVYVVEITFIDNNTRLVYTGDVTLIR